MMELINSLVHSPMGIVVVLVMGLALLLFVFWFAFYVVALPLAAPIYVMNSIVRRRHMYREKQASLTSFIKDVGLEGVRFRYGVAQV